MANEILISCITVEEVQKVAIGRRMWRDAGTSRCHIRDLLTPQTNGNTREHAIRSLNKNSSSLKSSFWTINQILEIFRLERQFGMPCLAYGPWLSLELVNVAHLSVRRREAHKPLTFRSMFRILTWPIPVAQNWERLIPELVFPGQEDQIFTPEECGMHPSSSLIIPLAN